MQESEDKNWPVTLRCAPPGSIGQLWKMNGVGARSGRFPLSARSFIQSPPIDCRVLPLASVWPPLGLSVQRTVEKKIAGIDLYKLLLEAAPSFSYSSFYLLHFTTLPAIQHHILLESALIRQSHNPIYPPPALVIMTSNGLRPTRPRVTTAIAPTDFSLVRMSPRSPTPSPASPRELSRPDTISSRLSIPATVAASDHSSSGAHAAAVKALAQRSAWAEYVSFPKLAERGEAGDSATGRDSGEK